MALPDQQAIERYRYMLKTAPPETIEQAHAEAFAQLTPEQRRMVLQQMAPNVPAAEVAAVQQSGASPQALARLATRAEMRQPGTMSMGGMIAGSLLSSIAGAVIGSMIAREFFSGADHSAAADSAQDWDSADADQALDGGDGGGFDV
jgi:hypothetical protein